MGRVFFAVVLLLAGVASVGGQVSAQDFNHVITVYATVAPQRGAYVDKAGNLVKVAGNTVQNIEPQAFDASGKAIPMTDSIMNQYLAFLKDHNNYLQAGKVYLINPVRVANTPSSQTVTVSASAPADTLSLQL